MYCTKCGTEQKEDAKVCHSCGTAITPNVDPLHAATTTVHSANVVSSEEILPDVKAPELLMMLSFIFTPVITSILSSKNWKRLGKPQHILWTWVFGIVAFVILIFSMQWFGNHLLVVSCILLGLAACMRCNAK